MTVAKGYDIVVQPCWRSSYTIQFQGVVTPIGTVVTAATGVKKFWLSFLLLDHLTAPQMGPWLFDRTHMTTLCAICTAKRKHLDRCYWVWKLSLTAWPTPKAALGPLTASWPRSQLWLQGLWEWPPLKMLIIPLQIPTHNIPAQGLNFFVGFLLSELIILSCILHHRL